MDTTNIPKSVTVAKGSFAGVYTSTKGPHEDTWSWYPPLERRNDWPHVTVARGDNVEDSIQITSFDGGVSTLKKLWWYKLHVSVDIHGRNLQMYYTINTNWTVTPCGNTMKHIPSHNKDAAQIHASRQSTDYKKFAEAFIRGARKGWMADVAARRSPATRNVGPQTRSAFDDESTLL